MKLLLLLLFTLTCKNETNKTNPYLSLLIGGKTPYSPEIYSMVPRKGNPSFTSPSIFGFGGGQFKETSILITGKNFVPSNSGNTILFNGTTALVDSATPTELRIRVPNGATSGPLSVANQGGTCNSIDKRSGPNCVSLDFYIDCYSPYNNIYGAEVSISTGTSQELVFENTSTKAIRSDLIQTLDNSSVVNTINIQCTSLSRVLSFSQSCTPSELTINGNTLNLNPKFSIGTQFFTLQYFITAGKGTCVVRVN
jgi:hypothetical protein